MRRSCLLSDLQVLPRIKFSDGGACGAERWCGHKHIGPAWNANGQYPCLMSNRSSGFWIMAHQRCDKREGVPPGSLSALESSNARPRRAPRRLLCATG